MSANNRYKFMERLLTYAMVADTVLFILYLIFAGIGVTWLKVLFTLITILLSAAILTFLYYSRELAKRRSLWISVGACAIIICLLFSLILNFPSPRLY